MGKQRQILISGEIIANNIIFLKDVEDDSSARKVLALCHCGKEFITRLADIKNGSTESCGCLKSKPKPSGYIKGDILGNNITFMEDIPYEVGKGKKALFTCHCGNTFEAKISDIKGKHTKSCGCLNGLPPPNKLDLKYGDILGNDNIFIEEIPNPNSYRRIGLFKCKCGNEFKADIIAVKLGHIKSCGCLKINKEIKRVFTEGEYIPNTSIIFIKDLILKPRRKALLQCYCGKEFISDPLSIATGRTKSCGCKASESLKTKYDEGQILGNYNLKYLSDITNRVEKPSNRRAMFKCHCGNEFETIINSVKTNNTTSCGCVKSKPEAEVKSFIQSLDIPFKANDRSVIKPKELDLIIPSHNLAIEFNGLFWHSELQGKDRKYHIDKTNSCKEAGYELIHIFEHQWINKQEIVKDIIRKRLGLVDTKIFARKCEIKELDSTEARTFLEKNHLQGYANATHKIGLYYNDELVSIMTFGASRYDKKVDWELIRFANKLGTNVLGGASKILKYFRTKYEGSLVSYCDISLFSGNLYKQLGFEFSHNAKPNYFYFDSMLNVYSRVSFQKHKLKDKLANFDPTLTEWENMLNNDFNRYWDCGNAVYILK